MNCLEFEELSMIYFDREASKQQEYELHEHINTCNSCKEAFESLKRMVDLLETPEEFNIDEEFTAKVMGKVREYEDGRARVALLIEKVALPISLSFLAMGSLIWIFIFNNINIKLVLFRAANLAKYFINVILTALMSSNIKEYIHFVNSQLQFLLPVFLVLMGLILSSNNKNIVENKK